MEVLERLKAWLQTYPGWAGGLLVDHTKAEPENFGLYPLGVRELSRTEDVLGTRRVRCRREFALYRVTTGQTDSTRQAGWLMDFEDWVRAQSMAGTAPQFGDVPETEQLRAEKGKLHKADQVGTGTYIVTITAEYTKIYKE